MGSRRERIGSHEIHEAASIYPLLEAEELRELADDIRAHGLREPVWRLWEQDPHGAKGVKKAVILDGRNRLRACELAGVPPTFREYEGPTDVEALVAFVDSMNGPRRHMNPSQRAMVATRRAMLLERAAAGRMRAGKRNPEANVPQGQRAPQARDAAGATQGVSGRLVQHAKTVVEKAAPEVVRAVDSGKIAVSAAAELAKLEPKVQRELLERSKGKPGTVRALVRHHEREEQAKKLNAEAAKAPAVVTSKSTYRVLVADPPWKYDLRDSDASHRGVTPYATMATEAICMLTVGGRPVSELGHRDSVLWLWTTNQHMDDAFDVARSWEYTPKAILTWVKNKIGLGHYLRNQTEHCLLCTRGSPTITLTNQSTVLTAPVREHSRKPDEFYTLVEELCPGSKLELFARTPREGWVRWGAESEKFQGGEAK